MSKRTVYQDVKSPNFTKKKLRHHLPFPLVSLVSCWVIQPRCCFRSAPRCTRRRNHWRLRWGWQCPRCHPQCAMDHWKGWVACWAHQQHPRHSETGKNMSQLGCTISQKPLRCTIPLEENSSYNYKLQLQTIFLELDHLPSNFHVHPTWTFDTVWTAAKAATLTTLIPKVPVKAVPS